MTFDIRVCRRCGWQDSIPALICIECGPTDAPYIRNGSGEERRVCVRCSRSAALDSVSSSARYCGSCGGGDFGWRSDSGEWAASAIDSINEIEGQWLEATFDGAYTGAGDASISPFSGSPKRFWITITNGVLHQPCYVRSPPDSASSKNAPPIRQNQVDAIIVVASEEVDKNETKHPPETGLSPGGYKVIIREFRLYDWQFVSTEFVGSAGGGVIGRLRGTAYGLVDFPVDRSAKPIVESAVPNLDVSPPSVNESGEALQSRDGENESSEGLRSDDARRDCSSCGIGWILFLAGFLWWLCNWKSALVGAVSAFIACRLNRFVCHNEIGLFRLRERLRNRASTVIGIVLVLLAIPLLLSSIIAASKGGACSDWAPERLFGLVGLLLLSSLQTLRWPRWLLQTLLLWALLADCTARLSNCNIPIASATAPSVASPSESIVAPIVSSSTSQQSDGLPNADGLIDDSGSVEFDSLRVAVQSMLDIVGSMSAAVTSITQLDQDLAVVGALSGVDGSGVRLVSIAQVARDPGRYLGCRELPDGKISAEYSIYLGEDALFDRGSDRLKQEAMRSSLRDLLRVMLRRQDVNWLIVGHADSSGSDFVNLPLSLGRANAIARWLEAHGIPRERLEVIGEGASVPLVRPSAIIEQGGYLAGVSSQNLDAQFVDRINRRVEISVDCPRRVQ